jgi:predicted transcriptional regulator
MSEIPNSIKDNLSPLESNVLSVLMPDKKMIVRDIYNKLKAKKVALTSIAVILDRLYDKGIVGRKSETCRGGVRYIYYPKKTVEELEKQFLEREVENLIERFGSPAVAYFNKRFSKNDRS